MTEEVFYTPAIVRALLLNLHTFDGMKEKGTLVFRTTRMYDFEDKVSLGTLEGACPSPSGRRNRPYTIDDLGVIICDIENALAALSEKQRNRIYLHYRDGYGWAEIAEMEGDTTEEALKVAAKRAIEKMADWLESPKTPVDTSIKYPRDESYKRKYSSSGFSV